MGKERDEIKKKKKIEKIAERMIATIEESKENIEKFLNGNNSAGTRIRKASMEIQKANKEFRDEVTRI
ncbi:hypothetical protein M0P65_05765, partial [Candidatus Gracilibacteria bacterium]|nr:hypothetical protein [Candidatus Gracilibacteria bacterium]